MDHSWAIRHKNLLFLALSDLLRRRVRSVVVTLCLAAILFPLVTALSIREGLKFQADIAVEEGADFYVSGDLCGMQGPISSTAVEEILCGHGLLRALPRVVGRTYFVDHLVAVVGLQGEALMALKPVVRGNIPDGRGEVILGEGIVRRFGISPGPGMRFTVAQNPRKVWTPTGILLPSCLWSADVMITHMDDANEFYRTEGRATQLLLYAADRDSAPPSKSPYAEGRMEGSQETRFLIVSRNTLQHMLDLGYGFEGGIFVVLILIGAALAIPAFLVTSGLGLKELGREIGVMKAVGWKTRDVLEKAFFENLLVSLASVSLSILASMVWSKALNGIFIAQFCIAEVGLVPGVDVPSRYLPSHALSCLAFALLVTQTGSLFSAWWKAKQPPSKSVR
jgi:ABC-type lipoprotein release transport system permease subunit